MFGRAFFGGNFYAPRYFGAGGSIVVVVPPPNNTSTILQRGPSGRHFSRKRYEEEVLAVREARQEALDRAEGVKAKAARALERAAAEAQKAVDAANETQAGEQAKLQQLAELLESAARAKQTADIISRANVAAIAAQAMTQRMQDDEDEMIATLLLS